MNPELEYYNIVIKTGHTQEEPNYKNLHYGIGEMLRKTINPKTLLELGPGPGALLEYCWANGIIALGIDANKYFRDYCLMRNPEHHEKYIIRPLQHVCIPEIKMDYFGLRELDACVSIEVFEHLPHNTCQRLSKEIFRNCKHFLFSSTPHKTDEDEKIGHINVREVSDWIELFKDAGFKYALPLKFPTEWTIFFTNETRLDLNGYLRT